MKADPNFSAAASCSELEKLVGRKINPGVSLAEQQERFPFLKDAPVEHAYAAGVKVRGRFKDSRVSFWCAYKRQSNIDLFATGSMLGVRLALRIFTSNMARLLLYAFNSSMMAQQNNTLPPIRLTTPRTCFT